MNVLFYRYGSICEPDISECFKKIGLTVIEETTEITEKNLTNETRLQLIENKLQEFNPLFVFSINFYPIIAELCHIYKIKYLCWTVDSPVPELFSSSILHKTNHIFVFDHAQYSRFSPYNPESFSHLPLAAATDRLESVVKTITSKERKQYSHQISFVGSLYREKNPLLNTKFLSDYTLGYLNALENASMNICGYNFIEASLTPTIVDEIKKWDKQFFDPGSSVADSASYVVAHSYIGKDIAMKERINTLNHLAKHFSVDLYTRSDTTQLTNVHLHGGVASLTEMPKIFHLSKINLNMTIKPIEEGIPLRVFDILGCGGFCMTNYQAELPMYFQIGTDLEAYSSQEELIDKCNFYLTHESAREKIAMAGHEKVCKEHTYFHRIKQMLGTIITPK